MLTPMFTPMLCEGSLRSRLHRAGVAHRRGARNLAGGFALWKPIFCLDSAPPMGRRIGEGRMLANVFSNTTPPRVEKAEGVPLLGLALSLTPYGRHCGSGLCRLRGTLIK